MSFAARATIAAGILSLAGLVAWASFPNGDPRLVIGESVAGDFAALATSTHEQFLDAAPAVGECMGSLRLEAAPALDDLARYDGSSRTIFVRVPATAASLEASLIHEFAHHLEHVCRSHGTLRPAFLAAQGHDPDTHWFGDVAWEDRPSEQFAEAVVEAVLGRRSRNRLRLRLDPESVRLVEAWLTTTN